MTQIVDDLDDLDDMMKVDSQTINRLTVWYILSTSTVLFKIHFKPFEVIFKLFQQGTTKSSSVHALEPEKITKSADSFRGHPAEL